MSKNASLLVNSGNSTSQVISLNAQKTIKIKIQPGSKYVLKNEDDNFAPENITLQRNGDNLNIILEGDSNPAIVIEDYYATGNDQALLGMAEDGQLYAYMVTDGSAEGYLLEDGSLAPAALAGTSLGDGSYLFANTETEDDNNLMALWPWFLGAAVAGIAGGAIYNHNKHHNKGSSTPEASPEQSVAEPKVAAVPTLSGATDMTGTITGPISYGSSTDEKNPIIYGTGEAGNTITIYDNGIAIGTAIVNADGTWNFKPETALKDGDHKITVTQTEPSGSISVPSDDFSFIVDTIAPLRPLFGDIIDNVGDIQGPIANGATTDDARPEITGTGEPGNTITIFINGEEVGKAIIDSNGNWTWTPETDLADGHYQVTITETDIAGNVSPLSPTFDFNIDTSVPVVVDVDNTPPAKPEAPTATDNVGDTTGAIEPGSKTDDATPTFNGEGDAGDTIIIKDGDQVIGSTVVDADGKWEWTPETDLTEGDHSITVIEKDEAGNESAPSDAIEFTVDTVAPAKPEAPTATDNMGDTTGAIEPGSKTDDATPTFNGEGDAGDIIIIKDGDEVIGSTVVDADGKWEWTPETDLSEGDHSITIIEKDEAGNESAPSDPIEFIVDTIAPAQANVSITDNVGAVTGALKDGDITDDNTPTFSGQTEANGMVIIYNGDEVIGSAKADANGDWTFTPDTLADGDYQFTATVTDEAGNTGEASAVVHITVDTSAVAVTITKLVDNVGDITGDIKTNGVTDDARPEIIGDAKADSIINLYDGETLLGSTTVDNEGHWSFTPATDLSEGAHSITATATDKAGNISEPTTAFTFTVDTVAPAKPEAPTATDNVGDTTGSIEPGSKTDDATPTFNGEGDAGDTIIIKDGDEIIGSVIVNEDGKWEWTPETDLSEGDHSITVIEKDEAGNESAPSDPIEFTVDTIAPAQANVSIIDNVGTVTGALKDGDITDDNTPTFSGQTEANGMVIIYNGDEVIGSAKADANGDWTFTPDTLADGDYQFTATVTDEAGNTGEASAVVHITVDTSAVAVTITKLVDNVGDITGDIKANDITDDARPEIIGKGKADSIINLYDDEILLGSTSVDAEGNWSFTPPTDLSEGAHSITATATDKAGNISEPTEAFIFSVDTVAPTTPTIDSAEDNVGDVQGTLTSNSSTDDTTPALSGTAEKNSTINVYDGETLLGSTTVDSNGKWTFTTDTLTEGEHTFHVTATDKAGNVSQPSDDFVLNIDFTAPGIATDLAITDNVGAVTGALKDGDTTDDNTPTFSGQAEANGMVIIYNGDDVIGSVKADDNGNWTFTPDTLADGDYQFTTTVTDTAGNTGETSAIVHITIDTSAVAVTITKLVDNVGDITGDIKANDITDDARPEIIGKGKADSTINVYDGETLLGSTTTNEQGNWSFTPITDLSEGEHSIIATATDKAGNVSAPTDAFTFTVDTVAPLLPTIESAEDNVGIITGPMSSGSFTDDSTPTLSGKAEKGSTVNVYDGETLLGSTTADSNGKWSFTTEALAEGEHKFHVTATDTAGNVSDKSTDFVLTMDFTSPDSSLLAITGVNDAVGAYTGNIESGNTTDDSRPTISGTGTSGDTIIVYTKDSSGSHEIGRTEVDFEGKWSLQPATALKEGENEFTAVEIDPVGNITDPSDKYSITLDTSIPEVPVLESVNDNVGSITGDLNKGDFTDDNTPTFTGTGAKNGIVTLYNDGVEIGTAKVDADGKWSFTPATALTDGEYKITVDTTNTVGQISDKTDMFNFVVDTTAPGAATDLAITDNVGAVTGALKDGDTTDDNTPTFSGQAEANGMVIIYNGDEVIGSAKADTNGDWTFTPDALADGDYQFTTTVTDAAGNTGAASATVHITIDTSVVTVAITKLVDNVGDITGDIKANDFTDDTRPEIIGEGKADSVIKVYDGETLLGSTTVDAEGNWSFTPATDLSEGAHSITATATDKAGNVSAPTDAFTFTVDTVAPTTPTIDSAEDNVGDVQGTLTSNSSTDDTTPALSGTAEKNSTVNVYEGETLLGSTTADSNGKWTFTTEALAEGEYTFHVTATDAAGNTSQPSNDFVLDIDFTAPGITTNLAITDNVGAVTGALKDGDTTDDNTPTFSGQAEANGMVIIYNGDKVIGSTKANASGDWTFTPDTLTDGDYQFTTTVTDAAGNTGEASTTMNITIDTSIVTVTITKLVDNVGDITGDIKTNDITDDARPEIIGEGKAGSVINVYDGETLLGSTTADAEGHWSFTPASDLSEGEHSITATATDKAGNTSEPTTAFTFIVDTVAPTAPIIDSAEDNVGEIQGTLTSNSSTDDATPTLNGTAEKNSTVNLYDGETLLGTTTTDNNGKWTFTTDTLTEGKHTFHVTATDAAGNVSQPSNNFVLTMDFTAPDASKLAITGVDDQTGIVTGNVKSGDITDETRPTISGTGTAGDTIIVYTTDSADKHIIGSTTVDAEGNWNLKPAEALAQGENKFTAVEMDPVGNLTDPCKPYTIILDTFVSDAKVTITEISDDRGGSSTDFITNDNTLLISGTLDKALLSDETVEITLDDGKTWTKATTLTDTGWTVDLQSTELDAGDYIIKARVVDTAGNIGSTDNHALTIALEGRDMNGLNTTAKISTDTSHGLVSGDIFSHSATITNTDMVTRDSNVTVSGTLSAALLTGEKLQISLDNGVTWATITMSGNNWSYVLPEVSVDTTYNYKLQVIDNAGNVGKNTAFAENYKVVIDLTVPDALTAAPDIATHVSTKDSFTFDSSHYGSVEAGTIVALVSDENGNGSYQEGLDQVLGFAKANADGSWSLTTSLPAGAHNLAFMVWDEAGNHSSMGASTSVGVTDGEGSLLIAQSWGGTTDADGRGLNSAAVTISQDGLWSFFQSVRGTSGTTTANAGRVYTATDQENYNSTYLAQPSTSNGAGYNVDDASYSRYINSAVFADINRDGYTDVMSQVSSYGNGGRTAYWMQNADGSFSPKAVDQGTLNHLGGVIAYDREGDGYLDFVLADSESDSISFLKNVNGVLSYEQASGFSTGHPGGAIPAALSIMHEVGAVDIDNNGTVDITAHVDYNGAGVNAGNGSRGLGILYNELTGTGKTNFGTVGYYANVFANDGADDYGNLSISMTYADYNGDGWLDLFLSRGTKGGANSDESRIYLNDGTGKLMATDAQALWFGDKQVGGTSLAVDWNHDGKMDIIEVQRSGISGSPMLYTNNGTNVWGANAVSLTGSTKFDNITGAVALDYDWDGSMDLVLYRSGSDAGVVSSTNSAPTLLVKNTNIAADGTSLQIRIVDGNGINTFYSNTVKLYNSAGVCVATQLINPQASGSSNSMGLVSFFGLDPNEVYSVQLLRITNGVTDHVGATSSIGGYTNNTVNLNWGWSDYR